MADANTSATVANTDIMLVTSIISTALFILSEIIPYLSPPQKGVCQCVAQVGAGMLASLKALGTKPSGEL